MVENAAVKHHPARTTLDDLGVFDTKTTAILLVSIGRGTVLNIVIATRFASGEWDVDTNGP